MNPMRRCCLIALALCAWSSPGYAAQQQVDLKLVLAMEEVKTVERMRVVAAAIGDQLRALNPDLSLLPRLR